MDTLKPICYMFIAVDVLLLLITYLPTCLAAAGGWRECPDRAMPLPGHAHRAHHRQSPTRYYQLLLLLLLMLVDVNDVGQNG